MNKANKHNLGTKSELGRITHFLIEKRVPLCLSSEDSCEWEEIS